MKNKMKGFTLVELLAVIVILAVIGMITLPIIVNQIEESKQNSYRVSVQNLIDRAKEYVAQYEENNDFPSGGINIAIDEIKDKLDLKSNVFNSGIIKKCEKEDKEKQLCTNIGEIIAINVFNGTYCARGTKQELVVQKVTDKDGCDTIDSTPPLLEVKTYPEQQKITVEAKASDSQSGIKDYKYCIDGKCNCIDGKCTDRVHTGIWTFDKLKSDSVYNIEVEVRNKNADKGAQYSNVSTTRWKEKVTTKSVNDITFEVSSNSYAISKQIIIHYPEIENAEYRYEIYNKNGLVTSETVSKRDKKLVINENGTIIAYVEYNGNLIKKTYIVSGIDREGPKVTVILKEAPTKWSKSKQIEVLAEDIKSELSGSAYSYNGGGKWEAKNTKSFNGNQKMNLAVRDILGNKTTKYKVCWRKAGELRCLEPKDLDGDGHCDLNCDRDEDGFPDYNFDLDDDDRCDYICDTDGDYICNDFCVSTMNIDINGDGICDYNCDTYMDIHLDNDGKCDFNCDDDLDGICDRKCITDMNHDIDGIEGCDINCDDNNDGYCDYNCVTGFNIDLNGDGVCDLNCDTYMNIDLNGDGVCDLNCDNNKDGICEDKCISDLNLKINSETCNLNCDDNNDKYCDRNCIKDLNIDINNDGICDLNCDIDDDDECDYRCVYEGNKVCDQKCPFKGDEVCDQKCPPCHDGNCPPTCNPNEVNCCTQNLNLDNDNTCDWNCDMDDDGKCDYNCDDDCDGKCDRYCYICKGESCVCIGNTCPAPIPPSDDIPPTCKLKVNGTPGKGSWYKDYLTINMPDEDIIDTMLDINGDTIKNIDGIDNSKTDINQNIIINDGVYHIVGTVVDKAGNIGTCDLTIGKDGVKPVCDSYFGGNDSWTTDRDIVVGVNCKDTTSGCEADQYQKVINGNGKTEEESFTIKDKAGNEEYCSHTYNKYIDTTPPELTIGRVLTATKSIKILYNASEDASDLTVECKYKTPNSAWKNGSLVSGIGDGTYCSITGLNINETCSYKITAINSLGNMKVEEGETQTGETKVSFDNIDKEHGKATIKFSANNVSEPLYYLKIENNVNNDMTMNIDGIPCGNDTRPGTCVESEKVNKNTPLTPGIWYKVASNAELTTSTSGIIYGTIYDGQGEYLDNYLTSSTQGILKSYKVTCQDYFIDASGNLRVYLGTPGSALFDYGTNVSGSAWGTSSPYSSYQYAGSSTETVQANNNLVVYRYYKAWTNINVLNPSGEEDYITATFSVSYDSGNTWVAGQVNEQAVYLYYGESIVIKDITMLNSNYGLSSVEAASYSNGNYVYTVTSAGGQINIRTKFVDTTPPTCRLKVTESGVSFERYDADVIAYGMNTTGRKEYNWQTILGLSAPTTYYGYVIDAAGNENSCSATITNTYLVYDATIQTCSLVSKYKLNTYICLPLYDCGIKRYCSCDEMESNGVCHIYKSCHWNVIDFETFDPQLCYGRYATQSGRYWWNSCNGMNTCYAKVWTDGLIDRMEDIYMVSKEPTLSKYTGKLISSVGVSSCPTIDDSIECSGSSARIAENVGKQYQSCDYYGKTLEFVSSTETSNNCSVYLADECSSGNLNQRYVSNCSEKYICNSGTKLNNSYCYTINN